MARFNKAVARYALVDKFIGQLGVIAKWVSLSTAAVLIAQALAGKQTNASFLLSYFGGDECAGGATSAILWVLALATTIWAILERKFRHSKTESLQGRIQALEKEKDPDRSSSRLQATGKTNPGDSP